MRIGYSHQQTTSARTAVEHNLFDRCDGELEIISSKSCDNVYRFNTFRACDGTLTLRHGDRCTVDANYFLGDHKKGSGGVRVIGEGHVVTNNYFAGLEATPIRITAGIVNTPPTGYVQVKNALVAFNTIVDCRGPYLDLDAGFKTPDRVLRPKTVTVGNNVFVLPDGGKLTKGTEGEGWVWKGNVAPPGATDHAGVTPADPKLEKGKDGLWHPAANSPVRGAAEGAIPAVKTDVSGRARTGKFDVGCEQTSDAKPVNRPLTPADVGPAWLAPITGK
jgi:poly(beta-D-mannuronate) lyase